MLQIKRKCTRFKYFRKTQCSWYWVYWLIFPECLSDIFFVFSSLPTSVNMCIWYYSNGVRGTLICPFAFPLGKCYWAFFISLLAVCNQEISIQIIFSPFSCSFVSISWIIYIFWVLILCQSNPRQFCSFCRMSLNPADFLM